MENIGLLKLLKVALCTQCVCLVLSRSCTVGFQLLLVENDEDREQSVLDVILVFLPPPLTVKSGTTEKKSQPELFSSQ